MRLRDILKATPAGNPTQDLPLLEAIDAYVINKRTPTSGKLQALAKMDSVLGLPQPSNPSYALRVYLATRAEDFVAGRV